MAFNIFEIISITFALLLILTRLLVVLFPNIFRVYLKIIRSIDCNLLALFGLLSLIFSLAIFKLLLPTVSFEIIISSIFAFALFIGAWLLVNNDLFQSFTKSLSEKPDNWVRINALLGLLIGLTILYLILYVK